MAFVVNEQHREALLTALREHFAPFARALTGGIDRPLRFQLLAERKDLKATGAEATPAGDEWFFAANDADGLQRLIDYNLAGWAVYTTVNDYPNGRCRREKPNVTRIRAAAAEFDCKLPVWRAPAGWTKGAVAGRSDIWDGRWPLPSIQVESKNGPHLWWVYELGSEPTLNDAEGINRAFAKLFSSDPTVVDASRILRVPGFLHWKDADDPFLVKCVFADQDRRYQPQQLKAILEHLGHTPIPTTVRTRPSRTDQGVRIIHPTKEQYIVGYHEAKKHVQEFVTIYEGERDNKLLRLCRFFRDLNLKDEDAGRLLDEWNTLKCVPSLPPDVLEKKWERSAFDGRSDPIGVFYKDRTGELGGEEAEEPATPVSETPLPVDNNDNSKEDEEKEEAEEPLSPEERRAAAARDPLGHLQIEPPLEYIELFAQQARREAPKPIYPVFVRHQRGKTLDDVAKALQDHPKLFQWNGELCKVVRTERGHKMVPLTKSSIARYVTERCLFLKFRWDPKIREWLKEPCGMPSWLCSELVDGRGWDDFRPFRGFMYAPYFKSNGTLATAEYDEEHNTLLFPDPIFKDLKMGDTLEEAVVARDFILDVIADFPLSGDAQRAACLAAMITPFCRHAIQAPAPMFLIDGNKPNIGKTNLMKVFSTIGGAHVGFIPWQRDDKNGNGDHRNEQQINTAFLAGYSIIALDNLKGAFGDKIIDMLLTARVWNGRKLSTNDPIKADNNMTVFGTANNIRLVSDVWRRVIPIRLVQLGPKKAPRHTLDSYLPTVRKQLVEACLTILNAFCVAGRPRLAQHLGSYESWCDWVASALVWLGMPDVTQLVETEAEASEDSVGGLECALMLDAVEAITGQLGKGEDGVTAQDMAEVLNEDRKDGLHPRFRELTSLMTKQFRSAEMPLTRADISYWLRRYRDNGQKGKLLICVQDKGHRRATSWRVTAVEDGE